MKTKEKIKTMKTNKKRRKDEDNGEKSRLNTCKKTSSVICRILRTLVFNNSEEFGQVTRNETPKGHSRTIS